MAHFKHYLEVFRHHLNCFWPFQWKWKENVIFNKICLLFWTPFCNWPYSGHIYYLENVPVGPISPVWPLNVIWDFKNLIWSRKISIEIVLLLRHCAVEAEEHIFFKWLYSPNFFLFVVRSLDNNNGLLSKCSLSGHHDILKCSTQWIQNLVLT